MYIPTATICFRPDDPDGLTWLVRVVWSGPEPIDRPEVGGWAFDGSSPRQRSLAERLVRAVNGGAVYAEPKLVRDVNNHTYVRARETQFFHKRHLDKSLKAVGY